jgi:hypothetical protein
VHGRVLGGLIGLRPTLWVGAIGGLVAVVPLPASPARPLVGVEEAKLASLGRASSGTMAG